MGLREEKKRKTREQILDTAERLIRSNGYESLTLRDIYDAVGISERSFYNYFATKEALLSELTIEWYRRRGSEITDGIARILQEERVLDAFIASCGRAAEAIEQDHEYMALLLVRSPVFGPPTSQGVDVLGQNNLRTSQQTHFQQLIRIFEAAKRNGELRDDVSTDEVLDLYTAVIGTLVPRWLKGNYKPKDKLCRRVERALEQLFYGLVPRDHSAGRQCLDRP